eukprot:696342-Prorocentrum_minimum.AAC.2
MNEAAATPAEEACVCCLQGRLTGLLANDSSWSKDVLTLGMICDAGREAWLAITSSARGPPRCGRTWWPTSGVC